MQCKNLITPPARLRTGGYVSARNLLQRMRRTSHAADFRQERAKRAGNYVDTRPLVAEPEQVALKACLAAGRNGYLPLFR